MHFDDGGSAFPCEPYDANVGTDTDGNQMYERRTAPSAGMSLRDWFAGHIMSGWAARGGPHPEGATEWANRAYDVADALIAEKRAREEQE